MVLAQADDFAGYRIEWLLGVTKTLIDIPDELMEQARQITGSDQNGDGAHCSATARPSATAARRHRMARRPRAVLSEDEVAVESDQQSPR